MKPRTASNFFWRKFCSFCICSCGFDDFEDFATARIRWYPEFGSVRDLAASRMWRRPGSGTSRIWWPRGFASGRFDDLAASRIWQLRGFGNSED